MVTGKIMLIDDCPCPICNGTHRRYANVRIHVLAQDAEEARSIAEDSYITGPNDRADDCGWDSGPVIKEHPFPEELRMRFLKAPALPPFHAVVYEGAA